MNIIIFGGSGYVGASFLKKLKTANHNIDSVSRKDCDLLYEESVYNYLKIKKPDYVINCAGYTGKPNVDACENNKSDCIAGNITIPSILARCCKNLGITWGHVSSGCIYTGRNKDGNGFTELDLPNFSFRQNNCSFYSGTKALSEEIILDYNNCHIWRLRVPFSNISGNRNYISKVMNYSKLLDVENSISNIEEFAQCAIDCMEKSLPLGIYNLTNPGSITTKRITELLKEYNICNKEFEFFESEDEFMTNAAIAPRSSCVLDSSKAISLGLELLPAEESVIKCLKNWT
jgi:dTDP-4-dehydrorhamnose reductase